MEGYATFYMDNGIGATSQLPIRGCVKVSPEHHVSIRSMFTGLDFHLPRPLTSGASVSFKIRGTVGDMSIDVRHVPELDCFYGEGRKHESTRVVVKFCFFSPESVMNKIPKSLMYNPDMCSELFIV